MKAFLLTAAQRDRTSARQCGMQAAASASVLAPADGDAIVRRVTTIAARDAWQCNTNHSATCAVHATSRQRHKSARSAQPLPQTPPPRSSAHTTRPNNGATAQQRTQQRSAHGCLGHLAQYRFDSRPIPTCVCGAEWEHQRRRDRRQQRWHCRRRLRWCQRRQERRPYRRRRRDGRGGNGRESRRRRGRSTRRLGRERRREHCGIERRY